jgi:hypothetical protein
VSGPLRFEVERLLDAPILTSESHESPGPNIHGPSLIRVPDWLPDPLGRYYLYFADHKGRSIRLAWANELTGPPAGQPAARPLAVPEPRRRPAQRVPGSR